MKLIKSTRLSFQEGTSDKVYEVQLCEVTTQTTNQSSTGYLVNFRFGRRGNALQEGTKTETAVSLEQAQRLFDSVVVSKQNKGYQVDETVSHNSAEEPTSPATKSPDSAVTNGSGGESQSTAESDQRDVLIKQRVHQRLQKAAADAQAQGLKRAVWRAGELRIGEALQTIQGLVGKGDELLDYCVMWSLGRIAASLKKDTTQAAVVSAAYQAASDLNHAAKSLMVRRISYEVLLMLGDDEQRSSLLETIYQGLPEGCSQLIRTGERDGLFDYLNQKFDTPTPSTPVLLYNLYLISLEQPLVRDYLIQRLPGLPLVPNVFKGVRYLFKAAEFRSDEVIFGLCGLLIERNRAFVTVPYHYYEDREVRIPGKWKFVKLNNEITKPDSRLAYTNLTRNYLRRRVWRSLNRLAIAESPEYVQMAAGVLLAFTDAHGDQGGESYTWRWIEDDSHEWGGNYERFVHYYPPYSGYHAFNQIIYKHTERFEKIPGGSRLMLKADVDRDAEVDKREESYPELWDRQPEYLIRLLAQSECEAVQVFAANAVADNQQALQQVDRQQLIAIINKPYAKTVRIGLQIARELHAKNGIDIELVSGLLGSAVAEARALAIEWLNADVKVLEQNPQVFNNVLTSKYADVRREAVMWLGQISLGEAGSAALVARVFAYLQGLKEAVDQDMLIDLRTVLLGPLKATTSNVDLSVIQDLLDHEQDAIKGFAGEILLEHKTPAEQLPAAIFKLLIESSNEAVSAIGVRLYGSLPDAMLLEQPAILMSYVLSESTQVRQAVRSVVGRLAAANEAFAQTVADELIPLLFRSEPNEGFHRDLIMLLTNDLTTLADKFDTDMTWRLLVARSNAANEYGAFLLQRMQPQEYSVRQWSHLAKNPVRAVREWAWKAYDTQLEQVKQNPVDALRILDNRWDDSREFAIDFFDKRFSAEDWTPELMVSVCDSTRDDVQTLGRDLISRFFQDGDGPEYLAKLSQHPSINVQLFTTNYLARYAVDDVARLQNLKNYFITVLSHVNKGRVAKNRVVEFLHQEAMKSQEAAKIAADIFARQSVSLVLRDKTSFIMAMRDICNQYPFIEMPIKKRAVELRVAGPEVN